MKFAIVMGSIVVVVGAIVIVSNEIGKFINDISPYDWNDFERHDVGNDFDSSDCQWK